MEQNYTEISNSIYVDALLMQQVIDNDYELLAIDLMLRNVFSKERQILD